MKYTLLILFFLLSSVVGATTYYISPTGSDNNSGTSSSPWKTLSYASSRAKTPGDIIHVNAGLFVESTKISLAPGVSIVGEGNTSVIQSNFSGGNLLELASTPNAGVNGNQSISYLLMQGGTSVSNLVGHSAIKVIARSNVNIHHCTFQNFNVMGIIFWGGNNMPTLYPVGCQFHDNVVTNCSRMLPGQGDSGQGSLCIGGQQAMLVYNNTITCNLRPSGNNGYCIKYYGLDGINKGLKIYNNTLTADHVPTGGGFNFAIEMWANAGGFEIYNNVIRGTIDIVNCQKDLSWYGVPYPEGAYSFGTKIYNNTIGWDTQMGIGTGDGEFGIRVEMNTDYLYIYNNRFKNLCNNIYLNTAGVELQSQKHINIYYNIMESVGSSSSTNAKGWGIRAQSAGNNTSTYDTWNISNNVISGKTSGGGSTVWGIVIPWGSSVKNINIKNNIISNFNAAPIMGYYESEPITNIAIENNIYFNNGNNNDFYNTGGSSLWTNYVNRNNIKANPMFVSSSDFHLQTGSPAIGKGLAISGLTSDFSGNSVKSPPSIGAYESGSSAAVSVAIPVIQNSIVDNSTPALLSLNYDLSLSNLFIPPVESFVLTVNGANRPISAVNISSNKVQLSLATAIKYGDVVTLSYTKPATSPIQTTAGGIAAGFSSRTITNNLASLTKDALPVTISMAVTPNHIHKTINVDLTYSSTLTSAQISAITPQILRITDTSGKLFVEKVVSAGTTNIKFPLNLYAGIYNVHIFANGVQAASQKIMVY